MIENRREGEQRRKKRGGGEGNGCTEIVLGEKDHMVVTDWMTEAQTEREYRSNCVCWDKAMCCMLLRIKKFFDQKKKAKQSKRLDYQLIASQTAVNTIDNFISHLSYSISSNIHHYCWKLRLKLYEFDNSTSLSPIGSLFLLHLLPLQFTYFRAILNAAATAIAESSLKEES